jgi:hypothetical protein
MVAAANREKIKSLNIKIERNMSALRAGRPKTRENWLRYGQSSVNTWKRKQKAPRSEPASHGTTTAKGPPGFLRALVQRSRNQQIKSLARVDGSLTSKPPEMLEIAADFYKTLYATKETSPEALNALLAYAKPNLTQQDKFVLSPMVTMRRCARFQPRCRKESLQDRMA